MSTTVAGIVLDADWSAPLSGVTVYAFSTNGYTEGSDTTDSNGYFIISQLTDRDWMVKLAPDTVGNILLVPIDPTPPEHREIRGASEDQHHLRDHYSQHHTGGDQALSLGLIAGTVIAAGHGDQGTDALAVHSLMSDADADTLIQLEEGADEDKVRVDTGGTERVVIDAVGIDVTGAITATSYGGITEANLVDKSAVEAIAGAWTFSGNTVIDDGSGTNTLEIPNAAAPTAPSSDGEVAIDLTVADWSHGLLEYYGGELMGVVAMPIGQFTGPTDNHVVTYNAATDEFELQAGGGAGDVSAAAVITDHALVRGDGGAKGVQDTGIIIDDDDVMTAHEIIFRAGGAPAGYNDGLIRTNMTADVDGAFCFIHINPTMTATANNDTLSGHDMDASFRGADGLTGLKSYGVYYTAAGVLQAAAETTTFAKIAAAQFIPAVVAASSATLTATDVVGCEVQLGAFFTVLQTATVTITEAVGLRVDCASTNFDAATDYTATNVYMLQLENPPTNVSGNFWGIQMDTMSGAEADGTVWPFHYGDIADLEFGITIEGNIEMEEEAAAPANPGAGNWKLYPKSDGWYQLDDAGTETLLAAGQTRIKLPPWQFGHTGDSQFGGYYPYLDGDGGAIDCQAELNLVASVTIPTGYKATHVCVYAEVTDADGVNVYVGDIDDGDVVQQLTAGSTNVNEALDADVNATTTNYLTINVSFNSLDVYGGYVTIAVI